jgi:hypothetical protein
VSAEEKIFGIPSLSQHFHHWPALLASPNQAWIASKAGNCIADVGIRCAIARKAGNCAALLRDRNTMFL